MIAVELWLDVFAEFCRQLQRELQKGLPMSEDTVRRLLSYSLMERGARSASIRPEQPHPTLLRKKIDLFVTDAPLGPCFLEFKYHRRIPSGWNAPRPQRFGDVLGDLAKLTLVGSAGDKLFVYVADDEMQTYLQNSKLRLFAPGHLTVDSDVVASLSKTVTERVKRNVGLAPSRYPPISLSVLKIARFGGLASALIRVR